MHKTCSKCLQSKPLECFKANKRYKYGVLSICRICTNLDAKKWRSKNPDKIKQTQKRHYYKNKTKQTQKSRGHRFHTKYWPHLNSRECLAEWNKMHEAQKGLCDVCSQPKSLEVDHDHKTGRVRSLLCNGCNTALARVEESIEILKKLEGYILKWSSNDH